MSERGEITGRKRKFANSHPRTLDFSEKNGKLAIVRHRGKASLPLARQTAALINEKFPFSVRES